MTFGRPASYDTVVT